MARGVYTRLTENDLRGYTRHFEFGAVRRSMRVKSTVCAYGRSERVTSQPAPMGAAHTIAERAELGLKMSGQIRTQPTDNQRCGHVDQQYI